MVFSDEDKVLIKNLYLLKNYGPAKLMSGAYDFEPVCGQEGDILNKLCDYVSNGQCFKLCQT